MPFGLKNAPQIFQKWMNYIFSPYNHFILVYIDDILVYSFSYEQHIQRLEVAKTLFLQHGVILGKNKIELCKQTIEYLGKIIDQGKIHLQEHIIIKIKKFPDTFETVKQLQSFLVILNYGRRFIPRLSQYTKNLQDKLNTINRQYKKDTEKIITRWDTDKIKIQLNDLEKQEIKYLKNLIIKIPKTIIPTKDDQLILYTDASNLYWAGVLVTTQKDIIGYTSRKFTKPKANYSTYEKKFIAILKSITNFKF
ncbi:hypothetical protein AXF42_Ash015533 [Apostasia shenzhenica]|uniref:Reverse transcriptase domain-containing protein n=1 Tax=Apostasia shenzhenica TaxID=1088818 RepID=A0A2I0AKG8_9ASPA|nr:hypothetical protein AXF42_Ash015533 [Apostasia shenzhenica]